MDNQFLFVIIAVVFIAIIIRIFLSSEPMGFIGWREYRDDYGYH